ncbi:uncharacterized protein LOC122065830 [Macadamia integrifolia]|uniref:uncharacterized protein LOC122065830 n=1 Tax=Macadamia integrifolia TaxID=60698 RepID=UPI001C4F335D|nr:uncharacterized protein LOC122065830 [Macadamia integrifolia]
MAATFGKFFSIILLLLLLAKSSFQQCSLDNITISQVKKPGQVVEGKPEYLVIVNNNCICTQSNLQLNCTGFKTVVKVDPSILSIDGNSCLFNNGRPFYGFTSKNFTYAWDTPSSFTPSSSYVSCS